MALINNIISFIFSTLLWPNSKPTTTKPPAVPSPAECAVCLSRLTKETSTRVLPCQHEFHSLCVETWLAAPHFKNTCPVCRFSIEDDRGANRGDRDRNRIVQECFITDEMVIWFSSFHVAGF